MCYTVAHGKAAVDPPLSSHHPDVVLGDSGVARHDRQAFGLRLRDEHPVERIAVMLGQAPGGDSMGRVDREGLESGRRRLRDEIHVEPELA